jgi:hypothetical protein
MKLIKILALAAAMATMATAQNPSGSSTTSGGKSPSPSPTPAKASSPATKGANGTKTPTSAGKVSTTNATGQSAGSKTASSAAGSPSATGKPGPATKNGTGTASQVKPPVATGRLSPKVKGGPAPQGAAANAAAKTGTKSATQSGPQTVSKTPGVGVKSSQTGSAKGATTKTGAKPVATKTAGTGKNAPVKAAEVTPVVAKKEPSRPRGAAGRRDPFISPLRPGGPTGPGPNCTTGKRCLSIPELVLQGTVKDISGKMLAVVVTSSRRTYSLRENDQVYNGSVEKITSDSIIFREFVKDLVGRETAREIVKKMGPPSP